MSQLYNINQVAALTDRSGIGIRKIAERYADRAQPIGQKVGSTWIFTDADVARIKAMPKTTGRPPKAKAPLPAPSDTDPR